GDRVAGVELDVLSEDELVRKPVLRGRPRLGQARRERVAGHRLHERVVQRVERQERRDDTRRLGGIEPCRGQGDVGGDRQLPFGRGRGGPGDSGGARGGQGGQAPPNLPPSPLPNRPLV